MPGRKSGKPRRIKYRELLESLTKSFRELDDPTCDLTDKERLYLKERYARSLQMILADMHSLAEIKEFLKTHKNENK